MRGMGVSGKPITTMSKKHRHSPPILHHVRRMRRKPTKAERALWQKLRRRQLGDYKFRRQHPIGNYIVDFYCAEAQLIVEVDGDVHAYQETKDAKRSADLEAQGYRVIRFWNGQVLQEMDNVLTMILGACDERS